MHSSVSGTHTGSFMGMAPTGRTFSDVHHIYIFTFRDGKIVEYRAVREDIALMRQLGAIPDPSAADRAGTRGGFPCAVVR
jgi:hypothetical protein